MSEKKHQVFISSTYSDLIDERRKLLDILLMADCIPAGMEAFVATDNDQFEVIKRVIDLCDYYVLIIGKRYGSVNSQTGLSYTEMEYEYAKEKGIPVLVFAIDDSVKLPKEKVEQNSEKANKLKDFRDKALSNRLASIWKDSEELTGKLAVSIMRAKQEIVRPGWQRAVDYNEASLRRNIMNLEQKNSKLEKSLEQARKEIESYIVQDDLAFKDKIIKLEYYYYNNNIRRYDFKEIKLSTIFSIVATEMIDVSIVESSISSAIENHTSSRSIYFTDKQIVKKLINQFKALGLIKSHWSKDRKMLYWGLTTKGIKTRDDMILLRNDNS